MNGSKPEGSDLVPRSWLHRYARVSRSIHFRRLSSVCPQDLQFLHFRADSFAFDVGAWQRRQVIPGTISSYASSFTVHFRGGVRGLHYFERLQPMGPLPIFALSTVRNPNMRQARFFCLFRSFTFREGKYLPEVPHSEAASGGGGVCAPCIWRMGNRALVRAPVWIE